MYGKDEAERIATFLEAVAKDEAARPAKEAVIKVQPAQEAPAVKVQAEQSQVEPEQAFQKPVADVPEMKGNMTAPALDLASAR
jgi:hypothetical protein